MRQLSFTVEEKHRYEVCYQAIVATDRMPPLEEWEDVVSLLRKLKAVGVPAKERIRGLLMYDLQAPATVELERSELNLLKAHIVRPIWRTDAIEDVLETKKWLDSTGDA